MLNRRVVATLVTVVLAAGGMALAAPSASADQIWYQGVGRPSADSPCPASSAEDRAAGWTEWSPSWAQWANGGKGGSVCTRSITWAHESTEGAGTCVLGNAEYGLYVVLTGWSIPEGTSVNLYSDPACSNFVMPGEVPFNVVWAPAGVEQAQDRCEIAYGPYVEAYHPADLGPEIYVCEAP